MDRYMLNPLHVSTTDMIRFQCSSLQARAIKRAPFLEEILGVMKCNQGCSRRAISAVLRNNGMNEDEFQELLDNNILLPADKWKEVIRNILEGMIEIYVDYSIPDNLETATQIFKYNENDHGLVVLYCILRALEQDVLFLLTDNSRGDSTVVTFVKNGKKRTVECSYSYDRYSNDYRGVKLTKSKALTSFLLERAGLPVPRQQLFYGYERERICSFIQKIGYPVCVKPDATGEGEDVFPKLTCESELTHVIDYLVTRTKQYVIEEHIPGDCFRLYVVKDEVLPSRRMSPLYLEGNGIDSIENIVRKTNLENMQRPITDDRHYIQLVIDEEVGITLRRGGNSPDSVPKSGSKILFSNNLKAKKNRPNWISNIHPAVKDVCVSASEVLGTNVVAIDYVTTDIMRSPADTGGAIIEVQDNPSFYPPDREKRAFFSLVFDKLFEYEPFRASKRLSIL